MKLRDAWRKEHPVPVWAQKLIAEVCREEGVRQPRVHWYKRPGNTYSSGKAWAWAMTIKAGKDRHEVREVVLHELSHVIMGQTAAYGGNTHHGAEFYAKLFQIGKRHGIGAQYIKSRERSYKPRGLKQGYRLYLKQLRGEA